MVVAIDPAVTSGEEADETGIVVVGKDPVGLIFAVQRDRLAGPFDWRVPSGPVFQHIALAVAILEDYPGALWSRALLEELRWPMHRSVPHVAEINNGGEMVEHTIRMIDRNVAFSGVHASRGKVVRAEPVAALYEQRRIFHLGSFPVLEDQMCMFTTDLDRKATRLSPDRVDALVWGFSELLVEPMPSLGAFELAREQAEAVIARRRAEEEARRPKPNPSPGSVEHMRMIQELNRPR